MAGDGADIEEQILKVSDSNVRHGTRNISPKNGAISVGIARRDAHTKAYARVAIALPFGWTSMEAMTGIRSSQAIAIPHQRMIAFDNGTDPDFGEFPEDPAHIQSDSRSRTLAEGTALKILPAQADS
jgi:hypothetical protein